MKQQTKLSSAQTHAATHQTQSAGQEFSGTDELLRFDAAQITVPPKIAERLKHSAGLLPPATPPRPWWKNLLGQ